MLNYSPGDPFVSFAPLLSGIDMSKGLKYLADISFLAEKDIAHSQRVSKLKVVGFFMS
jgi:hypothetical protein